MIVRTTIGVFFFLLSAITMGVALGAELDPPQNVISNFALGAIFALVGTYFWAAKSSRLGWTSMLIGFGSIGSLYGSLTNMVITDQYMVILPATSIVLLMVGIFIYAYDPKTNSTDDIV